MTTYVLMAGLPGTGKSTLATALAKVLGGVVLSKDTARAALFPGELTDYSREQDDLCFEMVLKAARYLARQRRPEYILLDGRTFSRREQIEQVVEAAAAAGATWKILLAVCPDHLAESRILKDADTHPAANRTVAMYREIRARFEPILRPHLEIDTAGLLELAISTAAAYLKLAGQMNGVREPNGAR